MTSFGPYELQRRLGAGGMAEVFLARRRDGKGGPVCIKRILPSLSSLPGFGDMFRDEAALAKRLRNDHIVGVLDDGDVDGVLYIALEYVDGCSLQEAMVWALQKRSLPTVPQALMVLRQLCRALAAAHGATNERGQNLGVVHRDVSPQNLLIDRQGTLKLTDFGVARAEDRLSRTQTGVMKGKLGYLAPEQITGDVVDHRADQFAAGIVAWEVLAGRRLFRGPELEVLEAVVSAELAPPSSLRPSIPPAVDAVVMKMLRRHPDGRFAGMAEVGAQVDRLMTGLDEGACSLLPLVDVLGDSATTQRIPRARFSREALVALPVEPPIEATGRWAPAPGFDEATRPDLVASSKAPAIAGSAGPTLKLEALDPSQLDGIESAPLNAPGDLFNDFSDHEPSTRSRMVRWALSTQTPIERAPPAPPSPQPQPQAQAPLQPQPQPPPQPERQPQPSPQALSPPARRASSPPTARPPPPTPPRALTAGQAAVAIVVTAVVSVAAGVLVGLHLDDDRQATSAEDSTMAPARALVAPPTLPVVSASIPAPAPPLPVAPDTAADVGAADEGAADVGAADEGAVVVNTTADIGTDRAADAKPDGRRDLGRLRVAQSAMLKGDYGAAADRLEVLLRIDPKNAEAHRLLGISYDRLSNPERAAEHYRAFLALAPRGPEAMRTRLLLERLPRAQP